MDFLISVPGKEFTYLNNDGKVHINGNLSDAEVICIGEKKYKVTRGGNSYSVDVIKYDAFSNKLLLLVNGKRVDVDIKDKNSLLLKKLGMDNVNANKFNELKSPMPGMVLDVKVKVGQELKKGDPILVLEAMKMENILKAPADLKVKSVHAVKGNAVEKNMVLVKFGE